MKTVEISVTAEDIAEGEALECTRCPVALAIWRVIPKGLAVQVHYELATYFVADRWGSEEPQDYSHADLPKVAQEFVARFDADVNGPLVQPFTFQLEVPEVDA